MKTILTVKPLIKQNLFQKLIKKQPSMNAFIEFNNLMASKDINEISTNDVSLIAAKYKVNLTKQYNKEFCDIYKSVLQHFLADKRLSANEVNELKNLKELLNLSEANVTEIHNELSGKIYNDNYETAVIDGRLTTREEQDLESLRKELLLPEEYALKISEDVRTNYLNQYVKKITLDERLSPEELEEFSAIAKSLNVNISFNNETRVLLDRYKLYWVLENGALPVLESGLNLGKLESCYFKVTADWYEERTVTRRVNYGGPTARVKIMKGVYYRVGSMGVNRITSSEMKLINSGTLYLTNKRLIFDGIAKNTTIKLDKILSFIPYSDGIEIEKDSGKSPVLKISGDTEALCIILSRLLKEN